MNRIRTRLIASFALTSVLLLAAFLQLATSADKGAQPKRAAVARTRKTVKMLDDEGEHPEIGSLHGNGDERGVVDVAFFFC